MSKLKNKLGCFGVTILLWGISRFIPATIGVLFPDSPFTRLVLMLICLPLGWRIAKYASKGRHSVCIRTSLYIFTFLEMLGLFTTISYLMQGWALATGRYSYDVNGISSSEYIGFFCITFAAEVIYILICFYLI